MERLRMKIAGMTCGHCVKAVERVLTETPGVKVGKVQVGAAEMEYEPGVISPAEIARRIGDEGYTAEVA
ncbi:MAG: heavy-metal-associated domain-containing protein [Terriglobales bacterium]